MNSFLNTIFFLAILLTSCKMLPGGDKRFTDPNTTFHLGLHPGRGIAYRYDVKNESAVTLDLTDKKQTVENRSDIGITYRLKDSSGHYLLNMDFDKIHMYSKNGEQVTEMDADAGSAAPDMLEKMLAALKAGHIRATLDHAGAVTSIEGYKEIGASVISGFDPNDIAGRQIAQAQWDQYIGDALIKTNVTQLFKIFPDSAVHLGEKWKIDTRQAGIVDFYVISYFKLKDINEDVAIIESDGDMTSDGKMIQLMGYSVTPSLKGKQHGEYEMDVHTGMLISSKITASVEGTLQLPNMQVPVSIASNVSMHGSKL